MIIRISSYILNEDLGEQPHSARLLPLALLLLLLDCALTELQLSLALPLDWLPSL